MTAEQTSAPPPPVRTWRPMALWTVGILLVLGLFLCGPVVCRWVVRAKLRAATQLVRETNNNPANGLALLQSLDWLPDCVVYPVLIEKVTDGSYNDEAAYALMAIEIKAYGGFKEALSNWHYHGPPIVPDPSARRWIVLLPRQLLEDAYAANHPMTATRGCVPEFGGSELVRSLEPDNPRWCSQVPDDEAKAARERLRVHWAETAK